MKKPIPIIILLVACMNIGVLLGYLFNGKTTLPTPNSPLCQCSVSR